MCTEFLPWEADRSLGLQIQGHPVLQGLILGGVQLTPPAGPPVLLLEPRVLIHAGSQRTGHVALLPREGHLLFWARPGASSVCVVYVCVCVLPRWLSGKESACSAGVPLVGKVPRNRKWQPTLILLPGEFHGQKHLVGHSPWGCRRVGHE